MRDLQVALRSHVPDQAYDYCLRLWSEQPFEFYLSRKRLSKLGDFRFDLINKSARISINKDLNKYQFLITYVHEVAHHRVYDPKVKKKPHGPEWKSQFKKLMLPLLHTDIFPDHILRPLARHMKNPKASTVNDLALFTVLNSYDLPIDQKRLNDLAIGDQFIFKTRSFELLEKKRTRALCIDLNNQKKYLIPMVAPVS